MSQKFTEAQLEQAIIDLLGKENYPHVLGTTINRDKSEVLIKEDVEKQSKQKNSKSVPEIEVKRGFYYDGYCFIYGAYYYYEGASDPFLFVPASVTAQVISNECGYA